MQRTGFTAVDTGDGGSAQRACWLSAHGRSGRCDDQFPVLIHSHMLRHSCGYKLANDGQDTRAIQGYLGRRSIVSTQRCTASAPDRLKPFWKD